MTIHFKVYEKYVDAYVIDSKDRVVYSEWLEEFEKRNIRDIVFIRGG